MLCQMRLHYFPPCYILVLYSWSVRPSDTRNVGGSNPPTSTNRAEALLGIVAHEQDTGRDNLYKNNGPFAGVAEWNRR